MLDKSNSIDLTKGDQQRDFVYYQDVLSAYLHVIKNLDQLKDAFNEFEIGSGQCFPVKEIVNTIKKLTNNTTTQLNFGKVPLRKNEPMKLVADIGKLSILGWCPKTSLEEGLQEMIAEYQSNKKE